MEWASVRHARRSGLSETLPIMVIFGVIGSHAISELPTISTTGTQDVGIRGSFTVLVQ
jgi:hypothetical protein